MPSTTLTPQQLPGHMAELVYRLGDEVEAAMRTAAFKARTVAVREISKVPGSSLSEAEFEPTDTGQMKRSYQVRKIRGGAVLENVAPHAIWQEHGTRPGHHVPPGVLEAWAIRKLRRSRQAPTVGKRRVKAKRPLKKPLVRPQEAAAQQLAARAKNSIRTRGIIPKLFHTAASQQFGGIVERELKRRLARVRS